MVRTYPLNDADYSAEDAELFHCTRTSGVFDGGDFECSVTGADNSVTVGVGIAWIRNAKFRGKVAALQEPMFLNLGVADAAYPRIDAVAIQFDANANKTEIVAIHGTPAANPEPPEPIRMESLYELHLYHVRREAGATAIPVGSLTDVRMNEKYCGLMQDDVTPRGGAITQEQLPVVPVSKGGTGAQNGSEGLKNLLAAGYMQLSPYQIVEELPNPAGLPNGAWFVKLIQKVE